MAGNVRSVGSVSVIAAVQAEAGHTVISLRGEADISNRAALWDVLLSRIDAFGGGDVVIDLAETTFIDSAIVRALASAQQLLARQGRILTFRSPSRLAARVLQVFGLTDLIENPEPVPQ